MPRHLIHLIARRARLRRGRPSLARWLGAALALVCLGSVSAAARDAETARVADEPAVFGTRTAFVPTPLDVPPIPARLGVGGRDALPVEAVGSVAGLLVADIGAERGKHLADLSRAVGPAGLLCATEISESGRAALTAVVDQQQLDNVNVLLASKTDVGLQPGSAAVALLSDFYQFVLLPDGRAGQDKHAFLTSLYRSIAPGGEVVVTYVTSDQLREDDTRAALYENTLADFTDYGFEPGRRWVVEGPFWPLFVFEFRRPADGPFSTPTFMGRTIATTMHWLGADWLLRAEREREEAGEAMLAALDVQPGSTVADFGCGNGYYTLPLARAVGPEGRVYGVDIQPEMLAMLGERASEAGISNIEPQLGSALDAPLPPGSCDLVLLADVYHEFSHPVPMLAVLHRALKPGGRVALLEFRAEDPEVPIKRLHKMSRAQVITELEAHGFRLDSSFDELPRQHLLFFERADEG